MLSYKAVVDHRTIGCDLHSRDFGYDREAGDQPLGGQNGELEMFFLLLSSTSNMCKKNGSFPYQIILGSLSRYYNQIK